MRHAALTTVTVCFFQKYKSHCAHIMKAEITPKHDRSVPFLCVPDEPDIYYSLAAVWEFELFN